MNKIILMIILNLSTLSFAQLNFQWHKTYGNLINGQGFYDDAYDIAMDDSGNVYITGDSFGIGDYSQHDFATIKYNSLGETEWIRRYHHASIDYSSIIKLDNKNNILVGGLSYDSSAGYSIVIIKYSSSGKTLWVKRYSDYVNIENEITSLTIDEKDNVYITGYSFTYNTDGATTFILKFDPDGELFWQDIITFGASLNPFMRANIDKKGNIYVTGIYRDSIVNHSEFLLIKYNNTGERVWLRSNLISTRNVGYDVQIDSKGNIYLGGIGTTKDFDYEFSILKYDLNGNFLWSNSYPDYYPNFNQLTYPNMIILDSEDNVYANFNYYSDSSIDIAVIKLNPMGNLIWNYTYDFNNSYENATDFAIDENDNIYSIGISGLNTGNNSFVILKLNPDGMQKIIRNENQFNEAFKPNAISINNNGEIAATGSSPNQSAGWISDFCTIKYSSTIGIQSISESNPNSFNLSQNYPNPFNPITIINYKCSMFNDVVLKVFDVLGNEVAVLVNEKQNPGSYNVEFDGSNFSSGVYFYKLTAGEFSETKRMVLIK
ncbi:MAG: T9SS type A sorting domain-containing protein [Ignavibacteria bacterium]